MNRRALSVRRRYRRSSPPPAIAPQCASPNSPPTNPQSAHAPGRRPGCTGILVCWCAVDRHRPAVNVATEIEAATREVAAASVKAVLLAGEAGIGKSRLVQILHERLLTASSPPTRIRMQCAPFHAASALHPVIRHLRHAAGFLDEDGPEKRLDKLEALIRQGVDNVRESTALLAPLLSLPDDRYGVLLDLTPEQRNERLMRALADQLLGLAARNTVFYLLEDAHWIDAATRDLIERLLAHIAGSRILVLITHRPEFQPDWTRHPHVTALTLNRLSRTHAAEVARAAGGSGLSEEIVEIIGERAGGVPLFIEELTKSALEDGKISGQSYIPESLQASLLARLDRLGGEARELAQLAAVIGREFDTQLLCAITEKKRGA